MMKRLAVLAVVALAACTPKRPPVVTPTPPPMPAPETITSGLVRRDGPKLLVDGQPRDVLAYVPCCMPPPENPDGVPPGWPMIAPREIDRAITLTTGALKANLFEFRPGPFRSDSEPDYKGVGGYVNDSVLAGVNPELLRRLDEGVVHAGKKGATAMVVLVDCWYCRHTEIPHPWDGLETRALCGVRLDSVQRAWVTAVVEAVGRHHNVVWLTGNECDVNPGYNPSGSYEAEVQALVREVEARNGFPVHMFGAQSEHDGAQSGPADFVVLHSGVPADAPRHGKPTLVLEYNPEPPYTPDLMRTMWCAARAAGTTWGAWRHGMPWEDWAATLAAFSQGDAVCEGTGGEGGCPFPTKVPTTVRVKPHGVDYYDSTPLVQDRAYCRSIRSDREACPVRPEGDPFREACEQAAMGGRIEWWTTDVEGDIAITVQHRGYGVAVSGHGRARLRCTFPAANGEDKCANAQGGELWIAR
jgi:hypothetical protein